MSLFCSQPQCYLYFMFLISLANFHRKASVIMVDELLSAYPHQLSFSEAGLRIMITSHFPPKTRLSMASRMLINEVPGKAHSICHCIGVGDFGKGEKFLGLRTEIPNSIFNIPQLFPRIFAHGASCASLFLFFPRYVNRRDQAPRYIEKLYFLLPTFFFSSFIWVKPSDMNLHRGNW